MTSDADGESGRLTVYDLLEQCATGVRDPDGVCESIVSFSKSESAPDPNVLSDILLDTLFFYESGVSSEDEGILAEQRERLGVLVANLIVSNSKR